MPRPALRIERGDASDEQERRLTLSTPPDEHANSSPREAERGPRERRNLDARPQRDAVAAYFGIHPSQLVGIPAGVIDVMAARLIGDRSRHACLVTRFIARREWPWFGDATAEPGASASPAAGVVDGRRERGSSGTMVVADVVAAGRR